MIETTFWLAILGATFSYIWYPLSLIAIKVLRQNHNASTKFGACSGPLQKVSLIITAHNEEGNIAQKLQNSLHLKYSGGDLEIIVASDASTDDTDRIVSNYADSGVRLVRADSRQGKEHAQSLAIQCSRGEILIFSDVSTEIEPHGIDEIVAPFRNPDVGAVSSIDRFLTATGKPSGESLYVRYEMWLRTVESDLNSLIGLSGSFFAVRREVCRRWDVNVPSDFSVALRCVELGVRAVVAPSAFGFYRNITDVRKEYRRKVRTVVRGIGALRNCFRVLNPFQFGMFSYQIFGHKIMRWLVPWFLAIIFLSNLALVQVSWIYGLMFGVQIGFYVLAMSGAAWPRLNRFRLVMVPYYFITANTAIVHATILYLLGRRYQVWTPSVR